MSVSSPNIFYYPQSNIDYNLTDDDNFTNPHRLNNIFNDKITASIPQIKLPSKKEELSLDNHYHAVPSSLTPLPPHLGGNNNNPFLFPQQQITLNGNGNGGQPQDINGSSNNLKTIAAAAANELVIDGARGGEGIINDKNVENFNNNNNNNSSSSSSSFLSYTRNNDDLNNSTPSSSYEYINSEMAKIVENALRTILAAMPLLPVPVFVPPNTDDVNINLEINNMMPFYFQQQAIQHHQQQQRQQQR